jgi:hypothetical protein
MPQEGWDAFSADSADPDEVERALRALSEIGALRRRLDEAELNAVRVARRAHRSWAEIATKLGITRQTAWEKWRELDGVAAPTKPQEARRRRGTVPVPDVLGLAFDDARDVLVRVGLVPVQADPDAAPLQPGQWHSSVVVRQYPDSGTRLRAGSPVKLWVERGGGTAGVREPRRPTPPVREASGEVDLDAVVGD